MPRRYTSASEDLTEPRVYVNNMNTRHPMTGLPTSRPAKVSAGVGAGASRARVGDGPKASSLLPAVPGASPSPASSRPRARVVVPAPENDAATGATTAAGGATSSSTQDLHPNLEQVYSRIMRRLQRQVNYEELNRVSLADQFGIDADEPHDNNNSEENGRGTRGGVTESRARTPPALSASSDGAAQALSARSGTSTRPTGVVPASSFVRFAAEKTNPAAGDDAEADDVELSLSSQPCPRTLRLVVHHVQAILEKKLQVAEQGSLKDCLRFTFESRALLDRLLKEIPSYTQYRDETAFLELERASKSAAASLGGSSSRVTGGTGAAGGGISRQKLHSMFEEFRKEPVLMPQGVFVQDPASGAVEAKLSTAQESAAQRVITRSSTVAGGSGENASHTTSVSVSSATSHPTGTEVGTREGDRDGTVTEGEGSLLPSIHTPRVPELTATFSPTASSAGSPLSGAKAAPGSVQVVYSTNDTGLSAQYTKLAKHLIGAASPNTKARSAGVGGSLAAASQAAATGRLQLPETYAKSVRLQQHQQPQEQQQVDGLADGGSAYGDEASLDRYSHTQVRSVTQDWAGTSASTLGGGGGGGGDGYVLVDAETGATEGGGVATATFPSYDAREASIASSTRRRSRAAAQQQYAFVHYSTSPRLATQRVDVGTLTDDSGLTTVPLSEFEALQTYARDLEVRLAEGRQHQEDLRAQLLEESSYADQKRHIVHYLRRTLLRECNTLRSQLTFASRREKHLQAALRDANAVAAAASSTTGGGVNAPSSGLNTSMTLATSMTAGARRSVFATPHTASLTPPPPTNALSSGTATPSPGTPGLNTNGNLDDDVNGIQSLLDLVLLGVENDETLSVSPEVVKRMDPDDAHHALQPNPKLAQEQLRAELDERQRQLKETILSLKVKHAYELAMKDREIDRLKHLTDIDYVHKHLVENVKKVRAEFRVVRNGLLEELQGFRVMMGATVKSLANRARMMDQLVQENVVLQNTLDASTDLIESATNLFLPMLSSEYTHGYHPWPVKLRNTIDPLAHLVQVRYGPAEVIRLRPSLDTLSELYLTMHWFVTRSVVMPDATRPSFGRPLKELCSAILRSPTTSSDVLFEVRRLYEREHQLMRQMARMNAKVLWNTYLQNAYAERSMAAIAEADLDPRSTTLPVQRHINALAAQRRELAKERGLLERERADNAKEVYRIWRDRQIDINEGHAPPLVSNRLTLLSEAQVQAAQRRGGNSSVAVRTNPNARNDSDGY